VRILFFAKVQTAAVSLQGAVQKPGGNVRAPLRTHNKILQRAPPHIFMNLSGRFFRMGPKNRAVKRFRVLCKNLASAGEKAGYNSRLIHYL